MFFLVLISLIIRAFLASILEFGNDEVYYWTYALYPDLSHFDHPPMVGYLIQLFTLNLNLDSELFIRLGAVLLGTFNTWLIFLIGKNIRDALTGFYAALLYTSSLYAFIIAGTFILPDTPQLTFWLVTIYFLLNSINGLPSKKAGNYLMLAGLAAGLALASKYTSVFLMGGAFLYVLFFNRKWFGRWEIYAAFLLALIPFIPAFWWNYNNDFISFTFQSDRVGIFDAGLRGDFFFTELGGQMLYNNPVNFVIGALAIISFFRKTPFINKEKGRLIILLSLPLIMLFLFFSLFRHTLPHWTGPAWTTIILLSAAWLRENGVGKPRIKLIPSSVVSALSLLLIVIVLGLMQIKGGMLFYDDNDNPTELGRKDVSLDMYGWKQLSEEFTEIIKKEAISGKIFPGSPVISHRWFPSANIDYYITTPHEMKVLGLGSLDGLHKYAWITEERGGFVLGMNAWYITVSRDFRDPIAMYGSYFNEIELAYTIPIFRNGNHVMNAFVYYLMDMTKVPEPLIH